jgi:hypothetical protein
MNLDHEVQRPRHSITVQLASLQLWIVCREEEIALDCWREVDKRKERDSQNRAAGNCNPLGGCAKETRRAG